MSAQNLTFYSLKSAYKLTNICFCQVKNLHLDFQSQHKALQNE